MKTTCSQKKTNSKIFPHKLRDQQFVLLKRVANVAVNFHKFALIFLSTFAQLLHFFAKRCIQSTQRKIQVAWITLYNEATGKILIAEIVNIHFKAELFET